MNILICNKCNRIGLDQLDFRIILNKGIYYYRKCCVECENKMRRNNYAKNINRELRRYKIYREIHKERIKQRDANYYENHKEEKKQYRLSRIDHYRSLSKQHYRSNKAYYISRNSKRRSLIHDHIQSLTETEMDKIELLYKVCEYLNNGLQKTGWHVDHIKPLSKGGIHHPDNLWIIPAEDNIVKFNNEEYELNHNLYFKV